MVLDTVRVDAYARAIGATVRPGDVVLDVGSGSGLLALLAAKAGARRVYAVERTGMVEQLRAHARANGFADVIVAMRRDMEELRAADVAEPVDVVVSETLGHFAPEEETHRLMRFAKAFTREDARWLPRRYRLAVAPVRLESFERELAQLDDVHGVSLGELRASLENRVIDRVLENRDIVGSEVMTEWLDVLQPFPEVVRVQLEADQSVSMTGVAVGFEAELSRGVRLKTGPRDATTCWRPVTFPIAPALPVEPGSEIDVEIRPRLVGNRGTWAWTVSCRGQVRRGDAMRSYAGSKQDLLDQLGLKLATPPARKPSARLDAWAAILGGAVEGTPASMAARLRVADPTRYPDEESALEEVLKLLRAAGALA